jgi:hypothetical protein
MHGENTENRRHDDAAFCIIKCGLVANARTGILAQSDPSSPLICNSIESTLFFGKESGHGDLSTQMRVHVG